MEATDQASANKVFEIIVAEHLKARPQDSRAEAERIQRENLGYLAGYYDHETRVKLETLFGAVHPIFGSVVKHGEPSPECAFKMVQVYGGLNKKGNEHN